jgi:hypothetical protein
LAAGLLVSKHFFKPPSTETPETALYLKLSK